MLNFFFSNIKPTFVQEEIIKEADFFINELVVIKIQVSLKVVT